MLTETQPKWLTEYLGECWHKFNRKLLRCKCGSKSDARRTFADPKDKQDLLEKIIEKGEWREFDSYIFGHNYHNVRKYKRCDYDDLDEFYDLMMSDYSKWLIQLSPLETAELVCKWKGVE